MKFFCFQLCTSPICLPYFLTTSRVIIQLLDLFSGFPPSTGWYASSLTCLQFIVIYHSCLSSFLYLQLHFKFYGTAIEFPSKTYFPIFCHICICSSFCLECLLPFPLLSDNSCLPPPPPAPHHQYIWQSHFLKSYLMICPLWKFLWKLSLQSRD